MTSYRTLTSSLSYWYIRNAKRCVLSTFAVFLLSFVAYMFFTVTTISASFAYDHVNKEISNTESRIADLEAERIARMKSVDLSFAKDRGFIEVAPTRYIAKNSKAERFSLR